MQTRQALHCKTNQCSTVFFRWDARSAMPKQVVMLCSARHLASPTLSSSSPTESDPPRHLGVSTWQCKWRVSRRCACSASCAALYARCFFSQRPSRVGSCAALRLSHHAACGGCSVMQPVARSAVRCLKRASFPLLRSSAHVFCSPAM